MAYVAFRMKYPSFISTRHVPTRITVFSGSCLTLNDGINRMSPAVHQNQIQIGELLHFFSYQRLHSHSAAADRYRSWQGFLALLRKHRPRQPLNGALLTVSLGDLLAQTDAEATPPRRRPARPRPGALRPARRTAAHLHPGHQGRPDRRLQRILRQSGQRGARPGVGRHLRRHRQPRRPPGPPAAAGCPP